MPRRRVSPLADLPLQRRDPCAADFPLDLVDPCGTEGRPPGRPVVPRREDRGHDVLAGPGVQPSLEPLRAPAPVAKMTSPKV